MLSWEDGEKAGGQWREMGEKGCAWSLPSPCPVLGSFSGWWEGYASDKAKYIKKSLFSNSLIVKSQICTAVKEKTPSFQMVRKGYDQVVPGNHPKAPRSTRQEETSQYFLFFLSFLFWVLGKFFFKFLFKFYYYYLLLFLFLAVLCSMRDDQGSNPCPLHWECGVLTTGLPGKSQVLFFLIKAQLMYDII